MALRYTAPYGLLAYSGVYRISHLPSGRFYMGSAVHFRKRKHLHESRLRRGKHSNPHLQALAHKYGLEELTFEVLVVTAPTEVLEMEQRFLDRVVGEPLCLNVASSATAFATGLKHTEAAKEKIAAAARRPKPPRSLEHSKRLSDAARNRPPISEETRAKLRLAHSTRPRKGHSAETKAKISAARRRINLLEET